MHTNVGATPRSVWVWSLYRMAKATTTTARTRATHFQISFGAEAAATLVPSPKPKQQTGTVPQSFPARSYPVLISRQIRWRPNNYNNNYSSSSIIPRKLTRKQSQRSNILTRVDSWHTDAYLRGDSIKTDIVYIYTINKYIYIVHIQ